MRLVKLCDILNLAFKKRNPTLCQLTYNHRDLSIHIERACLASLCNSSPRAPCASILPFSALVLPWLPTLVASCHLWSASASLLPPALPSLLTWASCLPLLPQLSAALQQVLVSCSGGTGSCRSSCARTHSLYVGISSEVLSAPARLPEKHGHPWA